LIKINKEEWNNQAVYLLENNKLRIWVAPEDGMNISQIKYDDQIVVKFDKERYEKKLTYGVPILYPTPNRVKDFKFSFDGVKYDAVMHGFTKNQKFVVTGTNVDDKSVSIEAVMQIHKGEVLYELFPFESSLKIKIVVADNEIKYQYTVCNYDDKKLPYGFAIHPFFNKNNEEVKIKVNASKVMVMTEDKLPTGELIDVKDTEFQLQQEIEVDKLELDHVYTDINHHPAAEIIYNNFCIKIDTTKDFSHIVVFLPSKAPFFCIENQTCSTDAHNMYDSGFETISGLEIAEPNEEKGGEITWKFISNN